MLEATCCLAHSLSGLRKPYLFQVRILSSKKIIQTTLIQFVIFNYKLLSYCFKEKIRFDVKASFASRLVSRLIRWYNKRILIKGYSVPRDFSWIENYKLYLVKLEYNKCLPIFAHVSVTYQNYVISKRSNHYVLKITYVLHKLAIFNAVLLLCCIYC